MLDGKQGLAATHKQLWTNPHSQVPEDLPVLSEGYCYSLLFKQPPSPAGSGSGACRGQKRVLDIMELGLQKVVNQRECWELSSCPLEEPHQLLTTDPSLLSTCLLKVRDWAWQW